MPYIPPSSTPAQRDAFAQRLFRHLLSQDNRASLMAVREAFAKAGGFPNAHAAEMAIRQDRAWVNPLSAVGFKPSKARTAYRFLGIHPAKLFEWAKVAWRKYPHLLTLQPFDEQVVWALLAGLWGFKTWGDALIFYRSSSMDPRHILKAPDLTQLHAISSQGYGNFKGLHISVGCTPEGKRIGLDFSQTLTHTLLLDEDRLRRYQAVENWINHRMHSNDGVFLMDASFDGQVAQHVQSMAYECNKKVSIFDLTCEAPPLPWLHVMSGNGLADMLFQMTKEEKDDEKTSGAIFNWLSMVSFREVASWDCGFPAVPSNLMKIMLEPPTSLWWRRDVGIVNSENISLLDKVYSMLPRDWSQRVKALDGVLGCASASSSSFALADLYQHVLVFRLPTLLRAGAYSEERKKLFLAAGFYKDFLSQGLGRPRRGKIEDLLMLEAEATPQTPLFCVSVDTPLSLYPKGYSVTFAQSRSMGACVLQVGPSAITSVDSDEAKAMIINMGTKIFHSDATRLHLISECETLPLPDYTQGVILRGDQQEIFIPDYTA